jgi:peptidoglycan/LPS O-acetylase OafA/YrhL
LNKTLTMLIGGVLATGLMLVAIWVWRDAGELALRSDRPEILRWAARSLAIAAAAGAQIIVLTLVLGRMYRTGSAHDGLRLTAALVCCIAAVTAAALGLAAQG